jgi:prostaglandin-endoperoxide synthase 2
MKDGREYPPFLYANGAVDPQFYDPRLEQGLSHLRAGRLDQWQKAIDTSLPGGVVSNPNRRDYMYAFGLDRGGSTIAYSAFTIIFMREHNRIARLLAEANKDWNNDDDRLFETARLINIRQLLTIVVNDYIRHIGGVFPFSLDRTFAEKKPWYRTNRISIEFNLVYRWHSLIPDTFTLAGTPLGHEDYRFNNVLVEQHGVERVISDASSQGAGRMGLFNTPRFMDPAEQHGLKWARDFGVRPFNDYRKRFGMSRYSSIDDFADGPEVAEALKRVYNNNMDEVEFTIGLFAEKRGENETMPDTLRRMVAYDAFTHILTNPVLSTEVHCPDTFSKAGWKLIQENATLEQVIRRNCDETKLTKVSLEV